MARPYLRDLGIGLSGQFEGGLSRRRVPPYSPDLNSIDRLSLKLNAHMRKAHERSIDTLWQRIGKLLDLFHPLECANFFSPRPTSTSAAGKPSCQSEKGQTTDFAVCAPSDQTDNFRSATGV
jgi:hypothetical protein